MRYDEQEGEQCGKCTAAKPQALFKLIVAGDESRMPVLSLLLTWWVPIDSHYTSNSRVIHITRMCLRVARQQLFVSMPSLKGSPAWISHWKFSRRFCLTASCLGFMYALIALGYTMVYGVLEFINFAHSEIFVLGAFVGVEVLLLLESAGQFATLHPAAILLL